MFDALHRLRRRPEWRFFATLHRAAPLLNAAWWALVVLAGLLPAALTVLFGWTVRQIHNGHSLTTALLGVGLAFAALLVLQPLMGAVSATLGSVMSDHLFGRLAAASLAPPGVGHLERPDLASDVTMARDFDQGILGPPLNVSMDFIASGITGLTVGLGSAIILVPFHWWAPVVLLGAWGSTHWLLRESGVWKDRNTEVVRTAQRHAEYAYRLAVDPAPAKELRYFGLAGWVIDRFVSSRRRLYDLQFEATRLREKSVAACLTIVAVTNVAIFWLIASEAADARLSAAQLVVFVQAATGISAIAFGGLSWALDGAAAPVAALERLEAAMPNAGSLGDEGTVDAPSGAPELQFRGVHFHYPRETRPVLSGIDLTIPAGSSVAIVGQNGAGKTTIAKLLCGLYLPTAGELLVDGVPLATINRRSWRSRMTAVFQDFVRFELPLRHNIAPLGASEADLRAALADAGAEHLADGDLDMVLSKAYDGGTDLSGGQWQRIALARALCAVRQGASIVLLDEPTAQLDVRGESEIFRRVLDATAGCTVILISHRFSTVRLADRIAVVEHGQVVEFGTHDELFALGGVYHEMFSLQADRFADGELDESGAQATYDTLD